MAVARFRHVLGALVVGTCVLVNSRPAGACTCLAQDLVMVPVGERPLSAGLPVWVRGFEWEREFASESGERIEALVSWSAPVFGLCGGNVLALEFASDPVLDERYRVVQVANQPPGLEPRWFRVGDETHPREDRELAWTTSFAAIEPYVSSTSSCGEEELEDRLIVSRFQLSVKGPPDAVVIATVQGSDPMAGPLESAGISDFRRDVDTGSFAVRLEVPAEAEPCFKIAFHDAEKREVHSESVCPSLESEVSRSLTLPLVVMPGEWQGDSLSSSGCTFAPRVPTSEGWAPALAVAALTLVSRTRRRRR